MNFSLLTDFPGYMADLVGTVVAPSGFVPAGDVTGSIKSALTVVLAVSAAISIVYLIIGGLKMATSAGEASKIKEGQHTLQWAIIGLIVTISAYAIMSLVTGLFGGDPDFGVLNN